MRPRIVTALALAALAVGLPLLALEILQQVSFASKMAQIASTFGKSVAPRDRLLMLFSSRIPLPFTWCAAAAFVASRRAPAVLRYLTTATLAAAVGWLATLLAFLAYAS